MRVEFLKNKKVQCFFEYGLEFQGWRGAWISFDREMQEKELKAAIMQMINQHKIRDTDGDAVYQFIDDSKIKKVYLNQQIYNALVAGSLVIARENDSYAFLPKALADRINAKKQGFIIVNNSEKNEETTDEEDPYAAYVIPDDLMW